MRVANANIVNIDLISKLISSREALLKNEKIKKQKKSFAGQNQKRDETSSFLLRLYYRSKTLLQVKIFNV